MSRIISPIWQIGLFTKLPSGKAECIECKKGKDLKFVFDRQQGSTNALTKHLFSALHKDSDYARKYEELLANPTSAKLENTLEKFVITGSGI